MRRMNKRANASFATDETGESIFSVLVMMALLLVGGMIAFTAMRAGPDNLCLFNSQASELFGWDWRPVDTKTTVNYLCNQWKQVEIIDTEFAKCDAFIDYDISECPYFNDLCDSPNFRDVSGGCIDQAMVTEKATNKAEFITQQCEYFTFCTKYLDSEDEPEKANLVSARFVAQQIGRYAERCVYMSNENDEFIVPCFSIEIDNFAPNWKNRYTAKLEDDHIISREFIKRVLQYTESAYSKGDVAHVKDEYYQFGNMKDRGGDSPGCYDIYGEQAIGGARADSLVYHDSDESIDRIYAAKSIKIIWIPHEEGVYDDGHHLGIISHETGCEGAVQRKFGMEGHLADA
jgi:hypothetical protein